VLLLMVSAPEPPTPTVEASAIQDATQAPPQADARLDRFITPEAREQIRREIAEAGGVEVFFLGRLNSDLVVEEVEALAFGNRRAVPAILQYARPGDVVIHNHPSGQLDPSDADISISSELGGRGVGSYIVDNAAARVRLVVKPFRQAGLNAVDARALADWLRPGGRIAEHIDGYEERPQQIAMLEAVAEAFNRDGIAVVEAGTGTGKSLAYLLPAIAWAVANNEKVVVATHTINLQEQLLEKDLPLLRQATGLKFEAAMLKGRNNYLCRRKAHYLRTHPEFIDAAEKDRQLAQIQEWIKTTKDGSRSDLPFEPDPDVWEGVMSEADNCLRARCPFYQKCFYYNARRTAAGAQVLVANHHLLMADLALRAESENYTQSAVLPPFHRVIVDEAHHLEEVATGYFGARAGRTALQFSMHRLMQAKTGDGLLRYLANKIHGGLYALSPAENHDLLSKLSRDLPIRIGELRRAMDEVADRVADAMERDDNTPLDQPAELKRRIKADELDSPFWCDVVAPGLREVITASRPLFEELRGVGRVLRRFLEDGDPEQATPILELHANLGKIESVIQRLMRFLGDDAGQCRWIEYRRRAAGRRRPEISFCIAPLAMPDHLREHLLRRFRSVVMTSATLTVERRFEYFLRQIGAEDPARLSLKGSTTQPAEKPLEAAAAAAAETPISKSESPNKSEIRNLKSEIRNPKSEMEPRLLRTLLLDTPFDYDNQVYLGVPVDLPDPTAPGFENALNDFLESALTASRGRAFVLFTAYSLLERTFARLAPKLEPLGYPCLRQGQTGRTMLTESFRRDIGSILFATSSFWEGVDVPGEALSCLVLTRLPFRVPGEPLIEARVEDLRRRGLDPFDHLIVPHAVIRFRQGFGRLIRNRSDRGAVLICDRRVTSKNYGRKFLASLPTANVHAAPASQVLDDLTRFFED
jgi:ATP-dependent DNA helicase DinG